MKSKIPRCMMSLMLFVVLAIPVGLAKDNIRHSTKHHRYTFIDLGTLGGPHSHGSVNGDGFQLLNNSGVVASYADLAIPDPNAAFGCYVLPECTQAHAGERSLSAEPSMATSMPSCWSHAMRITLTRTAMIPLKTQTPRLKIFARSCL